MQALSERKNVCFTLRARQRTPERRGNTKNGRRRSGAHAPEAFRAPKGGGNGQNAAGGSRRRRDVASTAQNILKFHISAAAIPVKIFCARRDGRQRAHGGSKTQRRAARSPRAARLGQNKSRRPEPGRRRRFDDIRNARQRAADVFFTAESDTAPRCPLWSDPWGCRGGMRRPWQTARGSRCPLL